MKLPDLARGFQGPDLLSVAERRCCFGQRSPLLLGLAGLVVAGGRRRVWVGGFYTNTEATWGHCSRISGTAWN